LINRSPTSALVDKMLIEGWSSHKTSLRYLKVFCCDSYAHVPKEKTTNLKNKVLKCIFIKYNYGMEGYTLWDLVTRKVIHIKSVIFRETKYFYVTLQPKKKKKEFVIQFIFTPEKFELRPMNRQEVEEVSSSSEYSKEEEEPPT
jgi:hypothetical protein